MRANSGLNVSPGGAQRPSSRSAWRRIMVGELWMLAAFVGLSLVVIALGAIADRAQGALVLGVAGALLTAAAFRGILPMLPQAERASPRQNGAVPVLRRSVSASPAPAHARITGITPTL